MLLPGVLPRSVWLLPLRGARAGCVLSPGCYPGLFARYPFGVPGLVVFYPRGVTPGYWLVTPSGCSCWWRSIPGVLPWAIGSLPLRGARAGGVPSPGCYPGLLARYPFGVPGLVVFYPRGVTPVCLLVTPSGCPGWWCSIPGVLPRAIGSLPLRGVLVGGVLSPGCYPGLLARYPFGVPGLVAFHPRGVTPGYWLVTPSGCPGWLRFVHECRPSGAESSQPRVTPWVMGVEKPSPCKGKSTSPFAFSCAPFCVHWFCISFALIQLGCYFVMLLLCL